MSRDAQSGEMPWGVQNFTYANPMAAADPSGTRPRNGVRRWSAPLLSAFHRCR
jgi:hypothetical protein